MKQTALLLLMLFCFCNISCRSQTNKKMKEQTNPLLCDPESGVCELPNDKSDTTLTVKSEKKPVKIIYYTDPICSSCWGIEPQLRKLKLEYGNIIEIEYRMGGLLPDWSYNAGGISKPSDVAHHWDEVSAYYDMPIDGDVWLEDPLPSSYPPSIAFKAAQMQSNEKAVLFLREIREMVFLQKKNITKWEYLEMAAKKVGLNSIQLKTDYEGKAKTLFEEDLKYGKSLGVRGFPTLFFINEEGKTEVLYGSTPYQNFENAVLKLYTKAAKYNYPKTIEFVLSKYHSLTAKEFSELTGTPRNQCEPLLDELVKKDKLEKTLSKNGALWLLKR